MPSSRALSRALSRTLSLSLRLDVHPLMTFSLAAQPIAAIAICDFGGRMSEIMLVPLLRDEKYGGERWVQTPSDQAVRVAGS